MLRVQAVALALRAAEASGAQQVIVLSLQPAGAPVKVRGKGGEGGAKRERADHGRRC